MEVSVYKVSPQYNKKHKVAFADFVIKHEGLEIKIKGCFLNVRANGRIDIHTPKLEKMPRVEMKIMYTPCIFTIKEQHIEFIRKAGEAVNACHPPSKWEEGMWCVAMKGKAPSACSDAPKIDDHRVEDLIRTQKSSGFKKTQKK